MCNNFYIFSKIFIKSYKNYLLLANLSVCIYIFLVLKHSWQEIVSPVDRSGIFQPETTKSSFDQLRFIHLMSHHLGIRWLAANPKHSIPVSRGLNFGSSTSELPLCYLRQDRKEKTYI